MKTIIRLAASLTSKVMDKMETDGIIKLCGEKTAKVCLTLKNGATYDNMNDDIEFIFKSAFDKRKAVWAYCADKLFDLANVSNDIRARIIKIMESGKAQEKFMITCFARKTADSGNDFFEKILHLAISDKTKKVKIFGAQRANEYSLYHFADQIKEESEKAEDEELKNRLKQEHVFLTKGYIIEKSEPEHGDWLLFYDGDSRIPGEIKTEEDQHNYVITKHKNRPRIEDLYYKRKVAAE